MHPAFILDDLGENGNEIPVQTEEGQGKAVKTGAAVVIAFHFI